MTLQPNHICEHFYKFEKRFVNGTMYSFKCELCGNRRSMGVQVFWKGLK